MRGSNPTSCWSCARSSFRADSSMIRVTPEAWAQTLAAIRSCGAGRRECVSYWVGPVSQPELVTRAVHPLHTASRGYYEVDSFWLNNFWLHLLKVQDQVRVQVHTHGGEAFHSKRDNRYALIYKPGFLSLVLPGFAMADDCRDWAHLAELDAQGNWSPRRIEDRLQW